MEYFTGIIATLKMVRFQVSYHKGYASGFVVLGIGQYMNTYYIYY